MLSSEEVRRLAQLARLTVSDDEIEALAKELTQIVGLVDQLSELSTEGVEPMVHAFDTVNVLAADVVAPSLPRAEALKNAPAQDGECFLVPPVLG